MSLVPFTNDDPDPAGYPHHTELRIVITGAYGNLMLAPANEAAARLLFITRRRYFKASDIAHARALGLTVSLSGWNDYVDYVEGMVRIDASRWAEGSRKPTLVYKDLFKPEVEE